MNVTVRQATVHAPISCPTLSGGQSRVSGTSNDEMKMKHHALARREGFL
jgi:hypothetical protein